MYSILVPPHWTVVLHYATVCPECKVSDVVYRLIAHLNDKHQWTRGSIADFVHTIEIKLRESELLAVHKRARSELLRRRNQDLNPTL